MLLFPFFARARSFSLSTVLMITLLERTPVLRTLITVESQLSTPIGSLVRALFVPAAALGAVHTLVGASTQLVANTALPAKATVGQPFAMSVAITGLGVSFAQSWDVTNSLPPGVIPAGSVISGSQFVINSSNGTLTLSGTPTTPGTYTFTARGYQFTNRTGPVTTGSTSIVVVTAPNSAPVITRAPSSQTLTASSSLNLSVTYTGTPAPTFQWFKAGVPIPGANGPTLSVAGVTAADGGDYTVKVTNSLGSVTSSAAQVTINAAPSQPVFATAPVPQTAVAGSAVILSVEVVGVPAPTLQWLRDGSVINGANSATLILNNISVADAGLYSVTAENASGVVKSTAALLSVTPAAVAPAIIQHPAAVVAAMGSTVVFSAAASGTPVPSFQWQHGNVDLPGENGPMLVLNQTSASAVGAYRVVVSNASGSTTSNVAALNFTTSASPSRLSNLSILTGLVSGESMIIGTVLGGSGTAGTKALLTRAVGPSLSQLGVAGVLPDPQLTLVAGVTNITVAKNNDWNGDAELISAFARVGAFAYASLASKDSAIFSDALAAGSYTIQVSDTGAGVGTVIAELYDATSSGAFTSRTPRLINVSVLKQVSSGSTLTAGFVVGGDTAKTVLVRAIGPGLAQFGVNGAMSDPRLVLFDGAAVKIAENDNWGGDPKFTAVGNAVGAFAITTLDSKDAMILVTLASGNYSAQVSVTGSGGVGLVEVYEVP